MSTRFVSISRRIRFAFVLPLLFLVAGSQDRLVEGRSLFEARQYDEAEDVFEHLAASGEDNAEVDYYLGLIAMYRGDDKQATKYIERAVQSDGNNMNYRLALADVYRNRTVTASFLSAGKWAGRWRRHLEATLAMDSTNLEVRDRLINYYLNAPGIAGGDKKKGRQMAEATIAIDESKGRLLLAYAYRRMDQPELAIEQYRTILKKDPDNIKAYRSWGLTLLNAENFEAAESSFRKMIEIAPDEASGYYWLGEYYTRRGIIDEAIVRYEKALGVDAEHSDARYALAKAYDETGRKDDAIVQYEKFLHIALRHYNARDARERLKELKQ
jgi:tetratricopeptide (TPR) repeat protein